jgi:hypothetical protein
LLLISRKQSLASLAGIFGAEHGQAGKMKQNSQKNEPTGSGQGTKPKISQITPNRVITTAGR